MLMARLPKSGSSTLAEAGTEPNNTESSCAISFANEAFSIFAMSLVAMGKLLLSFSLLTLQDCTIKNNSTRDSLHLFCYAMSYY